MGTERLDRSRLMEVRGMVFITHQQSGIKLISQKKLGYMPGSANAHQLWQA